MSPQENTNRPTETIPDDGRSKESVGGHVQATAGDDRQPITPRAIDHMASESDQSSVAQQQIDVAQGQPDRALPAGNPIERMDDHKGGLISPEMVDLSPEDMVQAGD